MLLKRNQKMIYSSINLIVLTIIKFTIQYEDSGGGGGVNGGRVGAVTSSTTGGDDECQWSMYDSTKLICKFKTINRLQDYVNFNTFQQQSTRTTEIRDLHLECLDNSYTKSRLGVDYFAALKHLQVLTIVGCKFSHFDEGLFGSLDRLRNLTVSSRNYDWTTLNLNVDKNLFDENQQRLEYLDLSDNNLWSLPDGIFCSLKSLNFLNLTRNQFRDLTTFHLSASISTRVTKKCGSNVEILDLSQNNLHNFSPASLSNLNRLKKLFLQKNGINFIADRSFEGLLSLESIDLSDNKLTNLPPEIFLETKNIKNIFLQNNSLNVLAPGIFNDLKYIEVLDLSHNKLSSDWINAITFKKMSNLRYLSLAYNKLTRLDQNVFSDLKSLESLRLQNNLIENLPKNLFVELDKLTMLILSYNRVSRIEGDTLGGLKNLKILSLDYNRISFVNSTSLRMSPALNELHLNGNKLLAIPDVLNGLAELKSLDLGENHIQKIGDHDFVNMRNLYGLRLTENNIDVINAGVFDKMITLQILNLSRNKIQNIDKNSFDQNKNLQAIRLDGNYITEIKGLFTNLPTLVWLNISDNRLETFDYAYIPSNLQWLDIHANKISMLSNYYEIESQLMLSTFDASSNRLTEIHGSSIPNSVEILYLNDNLISKIQSYTFFKKPNLTRVDLFGNKITTLDQNSLRISTVEPNKNLPEFFIGGNPFNCDCNLDWLQTGNSELRTQPRLMDLASIYCKLMYNRGNTYVPLIEAKPHQFLCEYKSHCFSLCHCCDFLACDCEMNCPDRCTCYHDKSWLSNVVDCSRASYDDIVPLQIPMDSTQLYLDGNNLMKIQSHTFIGRKKLKILLLNNTNLNEIFNRTFYGLIELEYLQLDHNHLVELNGSEFEGLVSLRELYLQFNRITTVNSESFRNLNRLEKLRLDHNKIFEIDFLIFRTLSLTDLRLSSNPWSCCCDYVKQFQIYLKSHNYIPDRNKVKCLRFCVAGSNGTTAMTDDIAESSFDGFFILYENKTNFCLMSIGNLTATTNSEIIRVGRNETSDEVTSKVILSPNEIHDYTTLLFVIFGALVISIVVMILMFIFRQEVRVWIFSKFGVRLCYQLNYNDKNELDKVFDAFITYSSKDEQFVVEELSPPLETDENGLNYKLCLHYRDSPPNAFIADTIVQGIDQSRRTIMILSENFIKSEWCRYEFRSAHHQSLHNRKHRLIVILIGDISFKNLDPDIRLYLKTNTFIEWGDKGFWKKLKFFLPDPQFCRRRDNIPMQSFNRAQNLSGVMRGPRNV